MDHWCRYWKLSLAAIAPMWIAAPVWAEEDPPKTTKTMSVVVTSDGEDTEAVLKKVQEQMKNSGLPEEQQEKILKQIKEAMAKASAAKKDIVVAGKAAAEAGKAAADAAKETATIVMKTETVAKAAEELAKMKEKIAEEVQVQKWKVEELHSKLPRMIQGRMLQQGVAGGPSYRIGISLIQTETGDSDDADENQKSEVIEVEGLKIENVLEDSPASAAGVQSGDVVVTVNGEKVKVFTDIQKAVQDAGKEGKAIVLKLKRGDDDVEVNVTPEKTEASDVGVMNLSLLPQDGVMVGPGFVFRGGEVSGQAHAMPFPSGGGAWAIAHSDDSLKDEIQQLKADVAELKEMVKKLLEK